MDFTKEEKSVRRKPKPKMRSSKELNALKREKWYVIDINIWCDREITKLFQRKEARAKALQNLRTNEEADANESNDDEQAGESQEEEVVNQKEETEGKGSEFESTSHRVVVEVEEIGVDDFGFGIGNVSAQKDACEEEEEKEGMWFFCNCYVILKLGSFPSLLCSLIFIAEKEVHLSLPPSSFAKRKRQNSNHFNTKVNKKRKR